MNDKVVNPPEKRIWLTFANVGKILGIVSLAGIPLCLGVFVGEVGIAFSIMGLRSSSRHDMAKTALRNNIIGLSIGLVLFIVYIVLFDLLMMKAFSTLY